MDEYELDDRLSEDEDDVDFCVNNDDILPDVSSDDIQNEEAMRQNGNLSYSLLAFLSWVYICRIVFRPLGR